MVNFSLLNLFSSFQLFSLFLIISFFSSSIAFTASVDEMSGELDVIHKDDFESHNHFENDYFIRDGNGIDWVQLHFNRQPPGHLRTGQRVRVKGKLNGRSFKVESFEEQTAPQNKKNDAIGTLPILDAAAPVDAQNIDERRVVVLMVDFTNVSTGSYTTPAQVAGKMYTDTNSVDGLYREASLGQTRFIADSDGDGSPDVFGPFKINYDNSTCDYYGWAAAAESAAQAAGINLSLYRHRVFVLPNSLPACSWNGVANVGCGTFCRAWIAGSSGTIFAHELGHNLNMAHAGTDPENDSLMNSEYGDFSDPMGSAGNSWRLFNAAHIDQMGWYANLSGAISTVTASGTFQIAPLGTDPLTLNNGAVMLKIAKPDTGDLYYLSYRQPVGGYNQLSTTYTKGINIHRYKDSGYGYTTHIKTLIDGETFVDTKNGISFTQVSHDSGLATIQVSFGCAALTPIVTISPTTLSVGAGKAAKFTVNITNQDVSGCSSTTFSLSTASGVVNTTLGTSELTLAPNQMGSSSLIADTYLSDGSYVINVAAIDNDGQSPDHLVNSQASATLVIDGTPPTAPTGLTTAVNRQGKIALSWKASIDNSTELIRYQIYRNDELITSITGTIYTDTTTVSGTSYVYYIKASDAAGNVSLPSNSVAVTAGGKTGGRK